MGLLASKYATCGANLSRLATKLADMGAIKSNAAKTPDAALRAVSALVGRQLTREDFLDVDTLSKEAMGSAQGAVAGG